MANCPIAFRTKLSYDFPRGGDVMTEAEAYHEMYLTMARAAEQAIRLLVEAQQACETLYMESTEQAPAKS